MTCLSDVVGILDMDGFIINKRFYCKELGLLKMGTHHHARFFRYWYFLECFNGQGQKDMRIRNPKYSQTTI